jgi:hypothetical protein
MNPEKLAAFVATLSPAQRAALLAALANEDCIFFVWLLLSDEQVAALLRLRNRAASVNPFDRFSEN